VEFWSVFVHIFVDMVAGATDIRSGVPVTGPL